MQNFALAVRKFTTQTYELPRFVLCETGRGAEGHEETEICRVGLKRVWAETQGCAPPQKKIDLRRRKRTVFDLKRHKCYDSNDRKTVAAFLYLVSMAYS